MDGSVSVAILSFIIRHEFRMAIFQPDKDSIMQIRSVPYLGTTVPNLGTHLQVVSSHHVKEPLITPQ